MILWVIQTVVGEVMMKVNLWAQKNNLKPLSYLTFVIMIPFMIINSIVTPILEKH